MNIIGVVVSVGIAQLAGIIGSVFTVGSIDSWYAFLEKPLWTPPSWVFAPVWTTLYVLMGVAAYLVWRKRNAPGAKTALAVYGVQLVLNALWSILFFGAQRPGWALVGIVVLFVSIVLTTILFGKIRSVAGMLLVPYIAWVSFAAYLNFAIWRLNG
jgi:tryptophan-rich sensory protein